MVNPDLTDLIDLGASQVSTAPGGDTFTKRVNTTDAWKFYAPASGKGKDSDYFFHHIALRNLLDHYQTERRDAGKPPIKRIILWSDGCGGQYMCSHNFVMVASFWKDFGVELIHRFAETSDFKGVHDTIGKEDRRWISRNFVADNITIPQPWNLYVAVRQGRPAPVFDWNQSAVTLARKPQLALDRYFYRFISWEGVDDNSVSGPDVIVANRDDKWGSSSVEGCMSHREYRSGSRVDGHDLRMRRQPCSCAHCRSNKYESCPFKSWVSTEDSQPDGWRRNPIMIQPRTEQGASRTCRSAQRSIIEERVADKQQRLARLASTIKVDDVVAFGVCESEREAQGVDFYLGKVTAAPEKALRTFRVGEGRSGWNVRKGEHYLVVAWYKEVSEGLFEKEGFLDTQLLEMLIELPGGKTGMLRLEPLPTATTARDGRGRRQTTVRKQLYKLHPDDKGLLLDQNYTQYVDRAASGSSA